MPKTRNQFYANNVEIAHNVIDHFRQEGIRVQGTWGSPGVPVTGTSIHDNVIALGDGCTGDAPGIFLVSNVDSSSVTNNIIFGSGDNGYSAGGANGYGTLIANQSDDNVFQGNLLFSNTGRSTFRILSGPTYIPYQQNHADRNLVRDNAFLFGQGGGSGTDDCVDDSNKFINNIMYGNYFINWSTKGQPPSEDKGHHLLQHNIFESFNQVVIGVHPGSH